MRSVAESYHNLAPVIRYQNDCFVHWNIAGNINFSEIMEQVY